LLADAEGRELLTYIVSCALPEGTTIVAEHPTTHDPLEFFGGLGLAAEWEDQPLDQAGRGWVSACLLARVNANDVTVPISLRGPHAQLDTTAAERADWTLEEGAFYGDVFGMPSDPIVWIACRGVTRRPETPGPRRPRLRGARSGTPGADDVRVHVRR